MQNIPNTNKLLKENSTNMNMILLGLTRKLFERYLSGEATEKEIKSIENWNAGKYWNRYRRKELDIKLENGCEDVWRHVTKQIVEENPELTPGNYPIIPEQKKLYTLRFSKNARKYAAVAAVFIAIAWSGVFFVTYQTLHCDTVLAHQHDKTIIQTGITNIRTVVLPDASIIIMNKGTKLTFIKKQFNNKNREVWLEGEAFFDVAKNKEKPFIIHTGTMKTTVRGTSFNIKAYTQTGQNVVSVRTGKVEVRAQNKVLAMLTSNKQIIYNTSKRTSETESIKASDITAWTNGSLVLNNANISELRLRLKQCFDVNLQVNGQALNRAKFNAVFKTGTSLDEVMRTISVLYEIKYKTAPSGDIIIFS
jgi:transmembrane sensor